MAECRNRSGHGAKKEEEEESSIAIAPAFFPLVTSQFLGVLFAKRLKRPGRLALGPSGQAPLSLRSRT